MFSLLALFGDIGCSLGSWLCGMISEISLKFEPVKNYAEIINVTYEQLGLKIGIGFTALFPVLMIILLILIPRKN